MKKLTTLMALTTLLSTSCNKNEASKAGYSGEDISEDITIIREKATKNASVKIYTDGNWALYGGPSVDEIDFTQPVAQGIDSGTFPLDITNASPSYFEIVTQKGTAIAGNRHLPMTGGYNFRDMGGYENAEGKHVKWGKIFRSDDLHSLTDTDLEYLAAIPLTSIVDFRSQEEVKAAADRNPSSVKTNYPYSINPGNLLDTAKLDLSNITSKQADQFMMDMNVLLVTDSVCISRYKDFFALLQNDKDVPLMFHCSAGKDRTGMAAALFLSALGVDEQTIMKDYLASNIYLANKYDSLKSENPALKSMFEVKPEFLQAGLDRIKKDHGSVENYLTKVLHVDIEKMKEKYLD